MFSNSNEFLDFVKKDRSILDQLKKGWVLMGDYEYMFSPAFGGERINILKRPPNTEQSMYDIYFAVDVYDL